MRHGSNKRLPPDSVRRIFSLARPSSETMKRRKLYIFSLITCGVVAFGLYLATPYLVNPRADKHETRGNGEMPAAITTPSSALVESNDSARERSVSEADSPVETESDRALRWLGVHPYSEIESAPIELIPWIALHHAKTTVVRDPAGTFRELQQRQDIAPGLTPWSFDMVFKEWYSVSSGDALKFLFSQDNRLSKWTLVNLRVATDLAPHGASPELRELVDACGGDAHDDVVAGLVVAACNAAAWDSAEEIASMTSDEARRALVLKAIDARRKRAR